MALDRHPSKSSAARHTRSDALRDQERSDCLRTALHGGGRRGRRGYRRNRTPPGGRKSIGRRVTRSPDYVLQQLRRQPQRMNEAHACATSEKGGLNRTLRKPTSRHIGGGAIVGAMTFAEAAQWQRGAGR